MRYDNIVKAINSANTIAIISHINPDGDTVGAGLALYKALQMYGKKPYIFCDNTPNGKLSVLPLIDKYNAEFLPKYDLAIAVDCADNDRLGELGAKEYSKGRLKAVVDHHKSNIKHGELNYIVPTSASTTQIMYNIVNALNCIDDTVAMLLYVGLVTDSGGFTFSSVSSETMRVAGELLKYDFKAYEICEHFLKKTKLNIFRLKNRVLNKAKFYDNNTIAIATFLQEDFKETNTDSDMTEGIINNLRDIDGVLVAVTIAEMGNYSYKISVRTGEEVDSSKITAVFGGGGHKNAAGCRISGFYEDVVDKLLKAVRDEIC